MHELIGAVTQRLQARSAQSRAHYLERLAQAATMMATAPGAMQLRTLQTMAEISTGGSSTIIFPLPVELLHAFNALGNTVAAHDAGAAVTHAPAIVPKPSE